MEYNIIHRLQKYKHLNKSVSKSTIKQKGVHSQHVTSHIFGGGGFWDREITNFGGRCRRYYAHRKMRVSKMVFVGFSIFLLRDESTK